MAPAISCRTTPFPPELRFSDFSSCRDGGDLQAECDWTYTVYKEINMVSMTERVQLMTQHRDSNTLRIGDATGVW